MTAKWLLILVLQDFSGTAPEVHVYANDSEETCLRQHKAVAYEMREYSKVTGQCYGPVYMEHLISERNKPQAQNQER